MAAEVCIAVFPTTCTALRGERAARRAGLAVRMVPVPRRLSADCNMGMQAATEDMPKLRELLAAEGIECRLVREDGSPP